MFTPFTSYPHHIRAELAYGVLAAGWGEFWWAVLPLGWGLVGAGLRVLERRAGLRGLRRGVGGSLFGGLGGGGGFVGGWP